MAAEAIETHGEFRVYEISGGPRSGKGRQVEALEESFSNVAGDETGADYRFVTRVLLDDEHIAPDMPEDVLQGRVLALGPDDLREIITSRDAYMEVYGRELLYETDVNETVGLVSPFGHVRSAVKEGFKARVEAVRDDETHDVLVVDGRNLASLLRTIEGVKLVLRTFVHCDPVEAARRECARQKLMPGTQEWYERAAAEHQRILTRSLRDAQRENDPVAPDLDAIDFWMEGQPTSRNGVRAGIGRVAIEAGRQIFYDTTPYRSQAEPVGAMVAASKLMFEEAMQARSELQLQRI